MAASYITTVLFFLFFLPFLFLRDDGPVTLCTLHAAIVLPHDRHVAFVVTRGGALHGGAGRPWARPLACPWGFGVARVPWRVTGLVVRKDRGVPWGSPSRSSWSPGKCLFWDFFFLPFFSTIKCHLKVPAPFFFNNFFFKCLSVLGDQDNFGRKPRSHPIRSDR